MGRTSSILVSGTKTLSGLHFAFLDLAHRRLHVVKYAAPGDSAHHHALFAPVKLERLAQFKAQRHKCFERLALLAAPLVGSVFWFELGLTDAPAPAGLEARLD